MTVFSPADGARINGAAQVEYLLRSPSGRAVRAIRVLVDGRPVAVAAPLPELPRGDPDAEATGHLVVPLPDGGPATITVLAASDSGRFSEPARVRVVAAGAGAGEAAGAAKGRLFALLVGVADYVDPRWRLRFAANDARDVGEVLRAPRQQLLYRSVDVRLLADRDATRTAILDGLRWLRASATDPGDIALLFVSSHGIDDHGDFRIVPADVDASTPASTTATTVGGSEMLTELVNVRGRVVVLLDACRAGGVRTALPDMARFANQATAAENGLFVYASSTRTQDSGESDALGHGVFTSALLEALAGRSGIAVRDAAIDTDALESFLRLRVQQLSRRAQLPVLLRPAEAPDFPLAVATE